MVGFNYNIYICIHICHFDTSDQGVLLWYNLDISYLEVVWLVHFADLAWYN